MTVSFEHELAVARAAAEQAGAEIARLRKEGFRYGHKGGHELVTEADIRAAEVLHDVLTTAFPDDGWLSEEDIDTHHRLSKDRVWIVDPIDGTREFLQGLPEYAVSIGLVVDGAPVLGVVHSPADGKTYAGISHGASEMPLSDDEPAPFTALVGRGEYMHGEVPILPPDANVVPMGSVAYRLARAAASSRTVVLTATARSEWDVAAGAALCAAAGLRVTDGRSLPLQFNQRVPHVRGLLIAEPALHERLIRYFRLLG